MLTSKGVTEVRENVVTDVNANVAAPVEDPKHKVLSYEAHLLLDKSVIARPLMTPELGSIHVKNPEYRYRWVNFTGRQGAIYTQRKAMGFENATNADVALLSGDAKDMGDEIRSGDLILMKIRADLYDAAIKYNIINALTLQRVRGVTLEGASQDVWADDRPKRVSVMEQPYMKSGLVKPFIPETGDIEKIVDESLSSGRADKTRKIMREMREKNETKVE